MTKTTDLAYVDQAVSGAPLDIPTINALTQFADAVARTRHTPAPIVVHAPAPAVATEPAPAPVDVRVPYSEPASLAAPSSRRLYTLPELLFWAGVTGTGAGVVSAVLAHRWSPLMLSLAGVVWILGSAIAIVATQDRPR